MIRFLQQLYLRHRIASTLATIASCEKLRDEVESELRELGYRLQKQRFELLEVEYRRKLA